MTAVSQVCCQCGAPFPVSQNSEQVECDYCGSLLEIIRAGDNTFTRPCEHSDGSLQQKLERIQHRLELEALNRQWERNRVKYCLTTKDGQHFAPNKSLAFFYGTVTTGLGVLMILLGISSGFRVSELIPIGLLISLAGVASSCYVAKLAEGYRRARNRFQNRRRKLLRKIKGLSAVSPSPSEVDRTVFFTGSSQEPYFEFAPSDCFRS